MGWAARPQPRIRADETNAMTNIARKLVELVHALPVIIMATAIYCFIGLSVGYVVEVLMAPTSFGHDHKYIVLGITMLSAVGSYAWMRWNHRVLEYINTRSN